MLDVDALRGFALLGILVVNSTFFASAFAIYEVADPAFSGPLDDLGRWIVAVLFTSKFYVLFSFLFGYSFTLQIDAAGRAGAPFVPRFLRRLLGLFAIGAAHAVLLWQGDILTTYAVLGLVLLALRGLSPRRAVRIAGGIVLLSALFFLVAGLDEAARGATADTAERIRGATDATAYWRGSVGDVIAQRLSEMPATAALLLLLQAPSALAMFLLGLAAGKVRLFARTDELLPVLRRVAAVCLPVGVAAGGLYAAMTLGQAGTPTATFGATVDVLGSPVLATGYVAALLLLFRTARGGRLRAALAPAGRMALSNYVLQSLVLALLFTGYGLGLVGHLGPLVVLGVCAAIFAGQLALSAWWLGRHRYGPIEWALRALTTWSWPPWRTARAAAS
nr:DUF418 domain-containing protein [Patulibacter sp. SYSU D01012]